jgi:pyruvate/2-oxoglutarate dehydrogenase complex dihydrolipoamide acyltransferase (E2) component
MRPNTEQVGIILQACGADIDSHCAAAARGPGWELKCLRDNAASLSAGCEQVLLAIASTAPAEPAAPAAAPPPAAAAPPPPAAPAAAAPAPAPAPAPAAAQRARPSREQMVMIIRACRGDMREHCAGAEGGPGSRIKCLRDNAANLSPRCRQAFMSLIGGR